MEEQKQDIGFTAGDRRLTGTLHWPGSWASPMPAVIGVHGLLSNRQSQKQIALARRCVVRGMAYLRFDHRGCGDSEGDLERDTSLAGRMADLNAALEMLIQRKHIDHQKIGFFGSSFGGTVALAVAAQRPVPAAVTLAAPIRSQPLMELADSGAAASIPAAFFDARHGFDLAGQIPAISHLLTCHGAADEIVPVAHAREIHGLARNPKELLLFPEGDHRVSNDQHRNRLLDRAVAWFSQHLKPESYIT